MSYEDSKHRPHAIHTGEKPRNPISNAPDSLHVTLDRWGPVDNLFTSMYDALQANWGDHPSRTVDRPCPYLIKKPNLVDDAEIHESGWQHQTSWCKLTSNEQDYVESCFSGKTLQQVLEGITFDFCIDGVSRAFTHQNVRTRLGAGFMQHGGRDNDWRHRAWTMPETMQRMCEAHQAGSSLHGAPNLPSNPELKHCITDWKPIDHYLSGRWVLDVDGGTVPMSMEEAIEKHIMNGRELYAALVDAGIPWQDARRVLFMGMQTYIHDQYNYLALAGVLANRLEHIMDWEFNAVAQLMLREIKMKCPPLLSKYLGSHSDKARAAKFAGLESWPPDGKYPNPYERCGICDHAKSNHFAGPGAPLQLGEGGFGCEACVREKGHLPFSYHEYKPHDILPRQHRAEQMPFFVLTPAAMAGGPVEWIRTNGTYPHA